MARLTSQQRKNLPRKAFAVRGKRAYPINDASHARNALARVAQHGTPKQKAMVRAAVRSRYPRIKQAPRR